MVYLLAVLLLLSGCTAPPTEIRIDRYPLLITSSPLPPPPGWYQRNELVLEVRLYVAADGSVRELSWIESSNDREWDAKAEQAILTWKYAPAMEGGKPVGLWVRNTVRVRFEEPVVFPLAEIVCPTKELADSVYVQLRAGAEFETLAKAVSIGPERSAGGYRGMTNIGTFPTAVRDVLRELREGEITKPLPLGEWFVIYRRIAVRKANG